MSGARATFDELNPAGRPVVCLVFDRPQSIRHSSGRLPDEAVRREIGAMLEEDQAVCQTAIAACRCLERPLLVVDLRGSTFVNTRRLGLILGARAAAIERGGEIVTLVDALDSGAGETLRMCALGGVLGARVG